MRPAPLYQRPAGREPDGVRFPVSVFLSTAILLSGLLTGLWLALRG